jgi:iron complex outermembrane receptor protein
MGQVEQRFFDEQLQLVLGLRFDDYSDFGNHFSPRAAVIYHPFENSALKFLYGNAFRAPSVNEQVSSGLILGGGNELKPEVVNTYELVWVQTERRWRYSLSAYYSKVKDAISIVGAPPGSGFAIAFSNATAFDSYGFELEASYRFEAVELSGNFAYNQRRQTRPAEDHGALPAFPDFITNLGLTYWPCEKLSITLNQLIHEGRETLNPGVAPSYKNTGPLSTRTRTDLHLAWRPWGEERDHEFYFYMNDVFDEADLQSAINSVENGLGTPGRQYSAGLRLAF